MYIEQFFKEEVEVDQKKSNISHLRGFSIDDLLGVQVASTSVISSNNEINIKVYHFFKI